MNDDTKKMERSPLAGTPESESYQKMMGELNTVFRQFPYLRDKDENLELGFPETLPEFLLRVAEAINFHYLYGDAQVVTAVKSYLESSKNQGTKAFTPFIFLGFASAFRFGRRPNQLAERFTAKDFKNDQSSATGQARTVEKIFRTRQRGKDYVGEILAIDLMDGDARERLAHRLKSDFRMDMAMCLTAAVQRKLGAEPELTYSLELALKKLAMQSGQFQKGAIASRELAELELLDSGKPPAPAKSPAPELKVLEGGKSADKPTEVEPQKRESEARPKVRPEPAATPRREKVETRRRETPRADEDFKDIVKSRIGEAVREVLLFAVPFLGILVLGLLCAAISGRAADFVGEIWFPISAAGATATVRWLPEPLVAIAKEFKKK